MATPGKGEPFTPKGRILLAHVVGGERKREKKEENDAETIKVVPAASPCDQPPCK